MTSCTIPARFFPTVAKKASNFVAALSVVGGRLSEEPFAFFRIFARLTMRFHPMFARGRRDARRLDRGGVVAEGVEQRGRRECVDESRDAAAERVDLLHRFTAERIAIRTRDAHAMIDVCQRVLEREGTEVIAHADALPEGRVRFAIEA